MSTRHFLLHALSPLHAGTGQSVGVIDLPIARMQSTQIPIVPGSSIKGVLRSVRQESHAEAPAPLTPAEIAAVFGPDHEHGDEHAGSLVVSDARLLAMPVKSFRGVFAFVSSPLLLELAARDVGADCPIPSPPLDTVLCATGVTCHTTSEGPRVFLADLDFLARIDESAVKAWAAWCGERQLPDYLTNRFVVVADDVMAFLWETATQIDARNRINQDTRTVAGTALWYEESLPPESVLIGMLTASRSRRADTPMEAETVLDKAAPSGGAILQFGGKATIGRGRCRFLSWG